MAWSLRSNLDLLRLPARPECYSELEALIQDAQWADDWSRELALTKLRYVGQDRDAWALTTMMVIHAFSDGEEVEPDLVGDWHTLFGWIFSWRSRFARGSPEEMNEPAALILVLECATRHANELEILVRREGVLGRGRMDVVRDIRSAIEKLTRYEGS